MARKLASVVFSLGCIHASSVMALGLGELKLDSFLNEPLEASVDLLNTGGLHQDEIKIRLATSEDFDKLGIDRAYFLTNISFEVVMENNGRARIKMASDEPVLEPYLDFVVEARWPSGRLLREYTVLIDPPVFAESSTIVSASKRVEEVEGIPASAKKKSGSALGGKGTKVNTRKSELPPGAMPQRGFNAATTDSPAPGNRYMISRDDTLWDIASRGKPAGVSVHQTMLDIQRLNPNAFINGNINRVKAGYIVYLPSADDISSGDLDAALQEVNEQNAAWREQRDAERFAQSGPKLRISAEATPGYGEAIEGAPLVGGTGGSSNRSDGSDSSGSSEEGYASNDSSASSSGGAMSDGSDALALADAGAANKLAAMQQQLETLQRIVNLKDEQIAALQSAMTDPESDDATLAAEAALVEAERQAAELEAAAQALESEMIPEEDATAAAVAKALAEEEAEAAEQASKKAAQEAQKAKAKPKITTQPKEESGSGWLTYALYGAGAVLLGAFAFLFLRNRRQDDEEEFAPVADAFSDVQLQEEELEIEEEPELEEQVASETAGLAAAPTSRGYGERKHDQYASDVEASDALAEADIYIAYGRHPQAIDLLNNALSNEPNNPVYRLKLIEVYTELGDRGSAAAQLEQLQALGDPQASAQGEAMLSTMGAAAAAADIAEEASAAPAGGDHGGPGLSPNPLMDSATDSQPLESEFTGLEIEDGDDDGELDLSADFEEPTEEAEDEEELVIAADANGLSTKMDLARAYLDMGDNDGARQILEEVVAEGSDELRAEAEALLDRIGD